MTEGFYWYRPVEADRARVAGVEPRVVRVDNAGAVWFAGSDVDLYPSELKGTFTGPITPPSGAQRSVYVCYTRTPPTQSIALFNTRKEAFQSCRPLVGNRLKLEDWALLASDDDAKAREFLGRLYESLEPGVEVLVVHVKLPD